MSLWSGTGRLRRSAAWRYAAGCIGVAAVAPVFLVVPSLPGLTAVAVGAGAGSGLLMRYEPGPGVSEELEALAAAERRCCSFVGWEVRQDAGQPVLWVTAAPSAPDAVAPIAAVFGAD